MRFPVCSLLASTALAAQIPLHLESDVNAFNVFQSDYSPHHSVRVKKQDDSLCNAGGVNQYTGWLDVGPKHLFFWFFESRAAPDEDPLVLWLNGGPGASSLLGLFEELGPCLVNEHGNGTTFNEYGWNKEANLFFVDQPAGVGFSYVDEDEPVPSSSLSAAEDMHIFMQILVSKAFPALKTRPFHISGESYAGHYVPVLAAQILSQNEIYPSRTQVNLQSILVGNGYFSPLDTAFGYWETLCTTNPGVKEPVFNETRCDIMATNLPRCLDLAQVCYDHPDPAICAAASTVCWTGVIEHYDGESYKGGRNRFDITVPCEVEDICYPQALWIDQYLNRKDVFKALAVPAAVDRYNLSSEVVAEAFSLAGDVGLTTRKQVLYLLEKGLDILVYQGVLDLACNTAGNLRWSTSLAWKGQPAYSALEMKPWSSNGKQAGVFKEVRVQTAPDQKKTRFTFLTVSGAGHMVPQDKPEAALDMMTRWIKGSEFA